jgi:peptidyl-prolyl cis-trans isomerase C
MIGKSTILIFSLLILLGTMVDGLTIDLIAQQQSVEVPPKVVTSDRLPLSVPGEILVTFDSHVTEDQVHAMAKEHGMTILEMNQALDLYRMSVAESVQDGIALARAYPFVETARPNYILADVGGESITLLDMESAIQQLPIPLRQIYTTSQNKEKLLRTMVNNKIFAKAAKEENLDEMTKVKRRIGAAIEWTLAQDFQRQVLEHISISEKELRDYYDEHVWAFQTPEQIKIREIVVDSKEEAHEIRKLIEEGKEFEQIARERSIGATAHSGGELGWFGRGRLDHAIEQTGFALKVGEIGFCPILPANS